MATGSATTASVRYKHNKSAPVHVAPVETSRLIGQQNNISTSSSPASKGVLTSLAADGTATFVFVFVSSIFSQLGAELERLLGLPSAVSGLCILVTALVTLDTFNNTFLGADTLNNPSNNVAFAAAGRGKISTHISRIVSQVVGGLLGAYAAIQYIPPSWQTDFAALSSGVKPGVSLWAGSACEAILAFLLNMAILYSLSAKHKTTAALLPLLATVILVIAGAELTGPSMNPAWSFSWYFFLQGHGSTQHLVVFWAAPLVGALAAGMLWHTLTGPRNKAAHTRGPSQADARHPKKGQ